MYFIILQSGITSTKNPVIPDLLDNHTAFNPRNAQLKQAVVSLDSVPSTCFGLSMNITMEIPNKGI
jgi:hypothetical protein